MDAILHIGSPKTGTSALQQVLSENRALFLEHGLFYPKSVGKLHNHIGLAAAIRRDGRLSRSMKRIYGAKAGDRRKVLGSYLNVLARKLEDKRPEAFILSAEAFWNTRDPDAIQMFCDALRKLADRVHVIAYVREPGDHYLSVAHQKLKASHALPRVKAYDFKDRLKGFLTAADQVTVAPFASKHLVNQDITSDFLTRIAPSKTELIAQIEPARRNTSLSAESMAILQAHRLKRFPDENDIFKDETKQLMARLKDIDQRVDGFERPKLHQHIRDAIVAQTKDLIWLQRKFEITFDGVEYARVGRGSEPIEPPNKVEQICPINPERQQALLSLCGELV